MSEYDYSYELTDEQLLYYSSLPPIAKLRWLDEARRFTILMRGARRTYYRDGKTVATMERAVNESDR